MNFIVAGLLYHSEEYIAFWNFINVYEILEFRDIYTASKYIRNYEYIYFMNRITWCLKAYLNIKTAHNEQDEKIVNTFY